MNQIQHRDKAIVLAWPETLAIADEQWVIILRKLGIVKNLNFRVGHAAILLVNGENGNLEYFDFGRYVTPREQGRARSKEFDPRLALDVVAEFDEDSTITNIGEILENLDDKSEVTHGIGPIYSSVAEGLNYEKAYDFACRFVERGYIPYASMKKGASNCAKFVKDTLLHSLDNGSIKRRLKTPKTVKSSPISNVFDCSCSRRVTIYDKGELYREKFSRRKMMSFFVKQLRESLFSSSAKHLPDDDIDKKFITPPKPLHLHDNACWLPGIGEGAWFTLEKTNHPEHYRVSKHKRNGQNVYSVLSVADSNFDPTAEYQFEHNPMYHNHMIKQNGKLIQLYAVEHESEEVLVK